MLRFIRKHDHHDPVIFVHGVGVPYQLYSGLLPLKKIFHDCDLKLLIAKTPTTATVSASAKVLKQEIHRMVGDRSFHLFGHSMGGIIARKVIAENDYSRQCLSVTTMSSPHRGSPVANWALMTMRKYGMNHPRVQGILNFLGNVPKILEELTPEYMEEIFNPAHPMDSMIPYYSMGFYIPDPPTNYTRNPYLIGAHSIQKRYGFEKNDGPVSIESSVWGSHLGNYAADHYAQSGPVPFGGKIVYKRFYQLIAENIRSSVSLKQQQEA